MCGIAGTIYFNEQSSSEQELKAMISFLKRRGPDAEGYWVKENIGFCHRRLSIIDLSNNASQPMEDEGKNSVITYNGEIYNYSLLKKELQQKGFTFHSESDTEVILVGYRAWDMKMWLVILPKDWMFGKALAFRSRRVM